MEAAPDVAAVSIYTSSSLAQCPPIQASEAQWPFQLGNQASASVLDYTASLSAYR